MPRRGYADVLEKKDPTKKVPLEEKIGRGSSKLAEPDRRHLREELGRDEEAVALAKSTQTSVSQDTLDRIKRNKMLLGHDDDLGPKSGSAKDRLHNRAKEIADILKKEMPSKREMWPKAGSPEAQQAVRHNLKFQEQRKDLCLEYQEIQRQLNPDDPDAQSLELIRPD